MQIANGNTRKVYIFKHFVVKVAQIYFKATFRNFKFWWKKDKMKALKLVGEIFWSHNFKTDFHPQMNLLAGIHANWLEFYFYVRHQPVFCQPTYFSFLGLINIQRKGELCNWPFDQFKKRMHQLTNNEIPRNDHTFDSPSNFTCQGNKLQCIDYADPRIWPIILKFGNILCQEFFQK